MTKTWLLCVVLCGCASSPAPLRVSYGELAHPSAGNHFDRPLVIEFNAGDRLPVELGFAGQFFALSPARPALELVAKRHCFVRVDGSGFRAGFDGKDFDLRPEQPGKFFAGLSITAEHGAKLVVKVETPRRAEPANRSEVNAASDRP
jgi:hypothetical protein